MKEKSVGLNTILNLIKTLGTYVFPLITYPYVFRVLHVEGVGRYNYAFSIISYFVLIAGLGINTYAIREGAKIRNDKEQINRFASEMLGISFVSTSIAYSALVITVVCIEQLHEYKILLLVLSPIVAATAFNMDWILNVYEDFFFVTVRTFGINIIALLSTFVFVRSSSDLYVYALIHAGQLVLISILNIAYIKKYIKLSFSYSLKKHVRPILVLFSMTIAIQIYVNVDTTMLGYLKGDKVVGLYNAANKIYAIMKTAVVAIVTTFIPRMTAFLGKGNAEYNIDKYKKYLHLLIEIIITLSIPLAVGVALFSNEIVEIISGSEYLDACFALTILAFAVPVCCLSTCLNSCVLIINDDEKLTLYATIAGAVVNMLLNLFFIPKYAQNGAAITTLLAEILVLVVVIYFCFWKHRHYFDISNFVRSSVNGIASLVLVIFSYKVIGLVVINKIIAMMLTAILSISLLVIFMIITKDKMIINLLDRR